MSSFQTPITIAEAIDKIEARRFLLPMIQREFVWDDSQIIKLFDSLMRGYPIGSFLFWDVKKETVSKYQFYEFITSYTEMTSVHNPKANVEGRDEITCVLDGQQRLSSLYIGLRGTYAKKMPYKRYDDPASYPKRKLYINLLSKAQGNGETGLFSDFRFLTDSDAKRNDEKYFWFDVGRILGFKGPAELNSYLIETGLMKLETGAAKFANNVLFTLFDVVHRNQVINYYLEKNQELDSVLNIFVRVNSAGTELSYSDLLLSIATAQWKKLDARDEITSFVDELNRIGEGFRFDKDFVLKSCLVLSDINDIAFKVDNFNKKNMQEIEDKWDVIKKALRLSVELSVAFGYSEYTLPSKYVLIPVAYYIKKIGIPDNFVLSGRYSDDRKEIRRWITLATLMRVFSGQPDSVLRPVREALGESIKGFPLDAITDKLKRTNKSLTVTEELLQSLLTQKYGDAYIFSSLSILYPTLDYRNKFHIDHIFPKVMFEKKNLTKEHIDESKWNGYLAYRDSIANLQLLEGVPNEEKSATEPKKWLETNFTAEERSDFLRRNLIPDELDFSNFLEFIHRRQEKIIDALRKSLGVA